MVFGRYGPRPDFAAAALWIEHGRSLHGGPWDHEEWNWDDCSVPQCFRSLTESCLPLRLHFGERYRRLLPRRHRRCVNNASRIALAGCSHWFATCLERTLRFLHDSHARWTPATLLAARCVCCARSLHTFALPEEFVVGSKRDHGGHVGAVDAPCFDGATDRVPQVVYRR